MQDYDLSFEDQDFLRALKHEPIRPARQGVPAEGIYLAEWQRMMQETPLRIYDILRNYRHFPDQRAANVCASFMVFMGCNCGRAYTETAEALIKDVDKTWLPMHMRSPEAMFQITWAIENQRNRGINSGMRTIEAMLGEEGLFDVRLGRGYMDADKLAKITPEDYDVVDCMVEWWGSREAREIRRDLAPIITLANDRQRKKELGVYAKEGNDA